MVKLRHEYASKAAVEDDIDAGAAVYCLNTLDVVLAWLAAEDQGARRRIIQGLRDRDEGLETLKKSLQGQLEEVDTGEEGNVAEMLTALIECL